MGDYCTKQFQISDKRCENKVDVGNKCLMHSGGTIGLEHIKEHISSLEYTSNGDYYLDLSDIVFKEGESFDRQTLQGYDFIFFNNCFFDKCTFNHCLLTNADFSNATINDCEFDKCKFNGLSTKFIDTTLKNTYFENSKFGYPQDARKKDRITEVSFKNAEFKCDNNDLIFHNCDFENLDDLHLENLKWHPRQSPFASCFVDARNIHMSDCTIDSDSIQISIRDDNFTGDHYRNNLVVFHNPIKIFLMRMNFGGHFYYEHSRECQNHCPTVYFQGMDFDGMKSARFIMANMKKAIFYFSQIETVKFANNKWHKEKKGLRRILYNDCKEFRNNKQTSEENNNNIDYTDQNELRNTYIQLKKNFEDKRDYQNASDWHFREMEAKRKSLALKWKPWKYISFIALYKLFSNYGEGYKRALACIGLTLACGAISYLFIGFNINGDRYEWYLSGNSISLFEILKDLGVAAIYSISNAGFMKSTAFNETSLCIDITNFFIRIFLAIFVPLFFVSLRRQFRR